MSLFVCSNCRSVENTALSRFWLREDKAVALCSACDPEIGKWHGRFERREYDGSQGVNWKDGAYIESRAVPSPSGT